jgi:uncharacterized protein with HEPN domain
MRHKKSDAAFLLDMLNAARVVVGYVSGRTREQYDDDVVNHDIIWRVATFYVPELISLLTPLIPPIPPDPESMPPPPSNVA